MNSARVNLLELGGKAQSKSELYRLLVVEGGCIFLQKISAVWIL